MSSQTYRVTFDASHKVKAGGGHVAGFLHHVARDLDDRLGVGREHANTNIDRARTPKNMTLIPDAGAKGGWRRARSVDELTARLDARLGTLKKPPRADAVILRPVVCNLSPEWFDEHDPDWRTDGLNAEAQSAYRAMLDHAVEEFGAANIVGASLHLDESLPQWQIAVTPVTDDGRLSQKDWYPGPTALRQMGVRFREAVAATGVPVNFTPSERSKEHLSTDEFQRRADQLRADSERAAQVLGEVEVDAAEIKRRARREGYDDGRADAEAQSTEERRLLAAERAQAAQEADAARRARETAERAQEAAERRQAEAAAEREGLRAVGAEWGAAMRELKARGVGVPLKAAEHARRGRDLMAAELAQDARDEERELA